jgi:hypothetical protein
VNLMGLEGVSLIAVSKDVISEHCNFCGAKHKREHPRFHGRNLFVAKPKGVSRGDMDLVEVILSMNFDSILKDTERL